MIKTCPICNRNFEALVANATYCNISCRKKAGREKEKEKRSAFYEPPKTNDERILWSETRPSLERLHDLAEMLLHVCRITQADRGIMIYGTMPDGWENTELIQVWEQYGMTPKCWAMTSSLPIIKQSHHGVLLAPPETPLGKEAVAAALAREDDEVMRRVMEEI